MRVGGDKEKSFDALLDVFPLAALSGAAMELFSPSKYDTVTVPVMIAAFLLISGCPNP